MNFEEMETTAPESQYDYDLNDFATVEWPDDVNEAKTVIGELLHVAEGVGQYDSTAYLLEDEDGDRVMVWGNASINAAFGRAEDGGLEVGDTVGIRQTGETYENKHGEFASFEVRYAKADN